ncbi:MAG: DUF4177 domain-containing protein [Sulfitobacter sp.]
MPRYEYKVVPAPTKGLKAKGIRTPEARFAHTVQDLMNDLSSDGWDYLRAETLPSQERAGLTGSTTEWRNVLVFRRVREDDAEVFVPELLAAPTDALAPSPAASVAVVPVISKGAESTPDKEPRSEPPLVADTAPVGDNDGSPDKTMADASASEQPTDTEIKPIKSD